MVDEKDFMRDQLITMAKNAKQAGITADVFEALLIALADELDFNQIMQSEEE